MSDKHTSAGATPLEGEKSEARYRQTSLYLICVNLLPLLGVLAFQWSISPIMLLYWMENIIIGFFNVLKMRRAQGPLHENVLLNGRPVQEAQRNAMIVFFILHYGIFTFVHGVFVLVLFGTAFPGFIQMGIAFGFLFASHWNSYRRHFLGGEYRHVSFTRLFMAPYQRVIVLHITILAGGGLAKMLNAPPLALSVMVILKIIVDLWAHTRAHKKLSAKSPGTDCTIPHSADPLH